MNNCRVDFVTFCHAGDMHRLYAPNQLEKQIRSNGYEFNRVIVVHQQCRPTYEHLNVYGYFSHSYQLAYIQSEQHIDDILQSFNIDPNGPQYVSDTDKAHHWRYHVVNHLYAATHSKADYIVFADSDCWIVKQPPYDSWVEKAVNILKSYPEIFIVSPNDGEPERTTLRMSQQMFLVNREQFINADFNQPGYSGNPRDYDTMPEYHALLEGRMEYHCRQAGKFRYVLGSEYRYFHHNRLTEDGLFDTDYEKLGWV